MFQAPQPLAQLPSQPPDGINELSILRRMIVTVVKTNRFRSNRKNGNTCNLP